MPNYSEIRGRVTKKIDVLIRANQEGIDLNQQLYAINWFSTKVEWLYHFYNLLAVRSVIKIGGRAFFKAKVTETLVDDNNSRRDLILIVKYPGGQNFKSLMESTYFKMVSVFRMLSVTKFTFGFTHEMIADKSTSKTDELYYAIHHFKTEGEAISVLNQITEQLSDDISVQYSGHIVANLYSQEKGKDARQIPNLMDAVIILKSNTEAALRTFFESTDYQSILKTLPSNHISFLNRTL